MIDLEEYYKTNHWCALKDQSKKIFNGCILTGARPYDLHHLNYFKLGSEKFYLDILPISNNLHFEFHEWAKLNHKGFYDLIEFARHKKIFLSNKLIKILKDAYYYNIRLRDKEKLKEAAKDLGKTNKKHVIINKEWYKKEGGFTRLSKAQIKENKERDKRREKQEKVKKVKKEKGSLF